VTEPITLRFTPTEQDYQQAARALGLKRGSLWISLGMMVLLEACLAFTLLSSSEPAPLLSWLFLLIPPLMLVAIFYGLPYWTTRRVKGNERLLAETTWNLTDEGVAMQNRFAESKLDWGSFAGLSENRDYFFLQLSANKRLHHLIPKRALPTAEEQARFRDFVVQHIPRPGSAKPAVS
jgi:hypothetical protein